MTGGVAGADPVRTWVSHRRLVVSPANYRSGLLRQMVIFLHTGHSMPTPRFNDCKSAASATERNASGNWTVTRTPQWAHLTIAGKTPTNGTISVLGVKTGRKNAVP
jgi:hypothetical protein